MTGIRSFDYFDHFSLCERLLKLDEGHSAYRTVVNRSYLTALMIGARILETHGTNLYRDRGFYDKVEEAVLRVTRDSNLMGDLKSLRKDRIDADYEPDIHITRKKAEECFFEAQSFIHKMRRIF